MSSLTICTYNVHSFYDEAGRCRVTDIAKLILQINPDIVCLQVPGITTWPLDNLITTLPDQNTWPGE